MNDDNKTKETIADPANDVEGHKVFGLRNSEDDDVEGHRIKAGDRNAPEDDDVEGHRIKAGDRNAPEDDDVEGHRFMK